MGFLDNIFKKSKKDKKREEDTKIGFDEKAKIKENKLDHIDHLIKEKQEKERQKEQEQQNKLKQDIKKIAKSGSTEKLGQNEEIIIRGCNKYLKGDSGDYKIIGKPMKGGMGIVYPVLRDELELFAAKTFQDKYSMNVEATKRFEREARIWISLEKHRNIIQAYHFGRINWKPYIFLEFITGDNLAQFMSKKKDGILSMDEAIDFAIQFCAGMSYAEKKCKEMGKIFVHRDIKPSNCLLTQDDTLKITDFGLSKIYEEDVGKEIEILKNIDEWGTSSEVKAYPATDDLILTKTSSIMGTLPYMSPEQFEDVSKVDIRSDVYSFGVMFFQMLTGRLPFIGRSCNEFYLNHKLETPPAPRRWNKKIPDDIINIIYKCLEKNPDDRFENFGKLLNVLSPIYKRMKGEEFTSDISEDSLTAFELGNKGLSLSELGIHSKAIECYDKAIGNLSLSIGMGLFLIQDRRGLSDLAKKDVESRINKEVYMHVITLNNKAKTLNDIGRHAEAIQCCDRALEINPQYVFALANKGIALEGIGEYIKAIECYDEVLKVNPNSDKAWDNKGAAFIRLEKFVKAIECLNEALRINPENAYALCNKGMAYQNLGKHNEAIESFDKALNIHPQLIEAWEHKGRSLGSIGKHNEAVGCFNEALRINPQNAKFLGFIGIAFAYLGKYIEAIEYFDRSLKIDPELSDTYLEKGMALGKLGRNIEAIECYDKLLKINSKDSTTYYRKGIALIKLGRNIEAIECFDMAIGIKQEYTDAYHNKGIALGKIGKHAEAIECFNKVIDIDPEYEDAYYNKGVALVKLGKSVEARECFDKSKKMKNATSWFKDASEFAKLGENFKAIECYDKALDINPNYAEAWADKGTVLIRIGKYLEALSCCKKAININPNDSINWSTRGNALLRLKKDNEAIECYNRAIEISPQDGKLWANKGSCLNNIGKYDEAIECCDKALIKDPKDSIAWVGKGIALQKTGRDSESRHCFMKAIQLNPAMAREFSQFL